jgi:Alginate lyase
VIKNICKKLCAGWCLGVALSTTPALHAQTAPSPQLYTLDPEALALSRQRVRAGDASVAGSHAALMRRAETALRAPLRSVTHKTLTPPSGSKHDFMTRGPYWWPNPNTPNGLPYVRRDGQRNPEVADGALDVDCLAAMIADTRDLSLAFYFSNEPRYAQKAATVLRSWFLDPATRMNPNLRFAQGIPGIAEGRGTGLIDTRDLWLVIDAVALLAPSGAFTAADQTALRQWFVDYERWFSTSEPGLDEAAAYNNHGSYYDAQRAVFLLFIGEHARARRLLFDAQTLRLASQIDREGRLTFEVERTRPFHYTGFTLAPMAQMAHYARWLGSPAAAATAAPASTLWAADDPRCLIRQLPCPLDLWHSHTDGRSLRMAMDYLARGIAEPARWPHTSALEPTLPLRSAIQAMLMAQRAYPAGSFAAAVRTLKAALPDDVAWLMWPTP